MELPSILTDAQVATFAATIALLVAIIQRISPITLTDDSKGRAILVVVLSAIYVGLSAPAAGISGPDLIVAVGFSFAALASASLGINRAGSFTVNAATTRASQPTVADYDPKATGDEGAPQG